MVQAVVEIAIAEIVGVEMGQAAEIVVVTIETTPVVNGSIARIDLTVAIAKTASSVLKNWTVRTDQIIPAVGETDSQYRTPSVNDQTIRS